ncbi:hypothetical protein D4764_12G0003820 [Takifugu flavidus]|uniref:G-protein coupled receptors family 1 profile domain-containing protein n=1 Tax=Takifugu flavidus TaxID=433684 RepID=A0A5C6PB49_9TELE|nr:hypothetical protein D4764_12G0003820 [Takifugu flavidus]
MQNLTEDPGNVTYNKSLSVIIKVCVVIPLFCFFLGCIAIMLHIFACHRQFLDTSRYILFAHMLINDTLQVLSSVLLFLFVMAQVLFKAAVSILFFAVVAVIILFTYMRILLETRKLRQDRLSVNKAMHTVLLHGFQLLLSVLAFTSPITETLIVLHANWLPEDISFFNYFCFILIPRFLSPLIYGFRDQTLRSHIGKAFLCCSNRGRPCVRRKQCDRVFAF